MSNSEDELNEVASSKHDLEDFKSAKLGGIGVKMVLAKPHPGDLTVTGIDE